MGSLAGDVATAARADASDGRLRRLARSANRPVVAIVAVTLIAGVLRFVNLDHPSSRVFDEVYYSKSGCIFLGYSNARCDIDSDDEEFWRRDKNDTGAWVHPPLGKWMIAGGQAAFGTDAFGWRFAPALFGTLTVMLLALIAHLLFGRPIWTFVTGLLLATEGLHFVHSRISMLDGLVTFWIVLSFALLLLDRRWIEGRTPEHEPVVTDAGAPPPPDVPSPLVRPWRIAAGIALGAAVATKWSGLTAVAGAVILVFAWEASRRRRLGVRRPLWRTLQFEGFPIVLFLLVLPAATYVVSYLGWFVHFGWDWRAWVELQEGIWHYHATLDATKDNGEPIHPYLSEAWQWLLLWRPVLYFARYAPEGEDWRRVIYANGNPAIFWGSLIAIPYVTYAWCRRREWRATLVVVAIGVLYLPWLVVSRPQFLFYAVPLSPFLVLACVYTIRDLSEAHVAGSRSRPYLPVAVGFVVVAVGLFVWFWPVLTGGPLSGSAWQLRAWFPTWV